MTSVWKRHGDLEVSLREFSTDFRVLVQDIESAYKLGPHRDVVHVEVRPYGDFIAWPVFRSVRRLPVGIGLP